MEKLNIPSKLKIGYQNRGDTYTGKLSYVTYIDEKGKLRKEPSWNGWRDSSIEPDEYDNEPRSGYVLNKGVGGARESWGWNARNEYIRVFDPRGFEFEISVANLLFILTHCDSFKGKGLDGEFVLAWSGADLMLLPVDCYEYKKSREFTDMKTMKVTKKDMKEGLTYQHKNTNQMVYLGRHHIRAGDDITCSWWRELADVVAYMELPLDKPVHVFYDLNESKVHFERGFTNLARVTEQTSHVNYATYLAEFMGSHYMSELDGIELVSLDCDIFTRNQCRNNNALIRDPNNPERYQYVSVDQERHYRLKHDILKQQGSVGHRIAHHMFVREDVLTEDQRNELLNNQTDTHFWPLDPIYTTLEALVPFTQRMRNRRSCHSISDSIRVSASISYVQDKELFIPKVKLKSGQYIEVTDYVYER